MNALRIKSLVSAALLGFAVFAQAGVAAAAGGDLVNGTATPSTTDYAQFMPSTGPTNPHMGEPVNGNPNPTTTDYAQ